jgi:hypothetical protein
VNFYRGKRKGKREKTTLEEKVKSIKRKNKKNGKNERSCKKNPPVPAHPPKTPINLFPVQVFGMRRRSQNRPRIS